MSDMMSQVVTEPQARKRKKESKLEFDAARAFGTSRDAEVELDAVRYKAQKERAPTGGPRNPGFGGVRPSVRPRKGARSGMCRSPLHSLIPMEVVADPARTGGS